jgi:hypothetical protein
MLIRETIPHLRHLEEHGLRLFTQGSSREFQTLPCEASVLVRLVHVESPRRSDNEHGVAAVPANRLPPPKKFTEVFWANGEHLIVLGEHLVKSVMPYTPASSERRWAALPSGGPADDYARPLHD